MDLACDMGAAATIQQCTIWSMFQKMRNLLARDGFTRSAQEHSCNVDAGAMYEDESSHMPTEAEKHARIRTESARMRGALVTLSD